MTLPTNLRIIVIKRLAAISLITLLVFNWYGYRILMNYMEQQATTQLQSKLDQNLYDESTLIEIRVPLNMPYIANWNDFETFYGETEIAGTHYTYVKRKVENGELVLLCIPNTAKTELQAAKINYFKLVNDLQQPTGKQDSKNLSVKIPYSDYIANSSMTTINPWAVTTTSVLRPYVFVMPTVYIPTPAQPPEC